MKFDKNDTAVVMIDPQNEVLSETGLGWPLLRESLHENYTVENMERIFKSAKELGFEIFISPHYFYPTDKGWKFNGALETDEAASGMFSRKGVYCTSMIVSPFVLDRNVPLIGPLRGGQIGADGDEQGGVAKSGGAGAGTESAAAGGGCSAADARELSAGE